jgi:tetratricopeptide (TPR) repeat protein
MGCGSMSKVNDGNLPLDTSQKRISPTQMKQSTKLHSIFIEDTDSLNNMFTMSQNSLQYFGVESIASSVLHTTTTTRQKSIMYVMKGDHCCANASDPNPKSRYLIHKRALIYYRRANNYDKANVDSIIGIAKCLVLLNYYEKALEYLEKVNRKINLSKLSEYWRLQGVCNRKLAKIWLLEVNEKENNLEKADKYFKNALAIAQTQEIVKEKEVVERLINIESKFKRDIGRYLKFMMDNTLNYEISTTRNRSEKEFYKILSIDGSGVVGIMSTFVLTEIEKQCNRYLPDLFNTFSGTSTGGIIASMITIPENERSTKPLYSVSEQLQIYIDNGKDIFPKLNNISKYLGHTSRCSKILHEIYQNKTKGFYLSQTLNDLIVASVNCDDVPCTEYFINYDAKHLKSKDTLLADVLMATSTKPPYFAPYKIRGLGSFLDGSLATRNSSRKAFEEAEQRFNKSKSEIFVLSLNTEVSTVSLSDSTVSEPSGTDGDMAAHTLWSSSLSNSMAALKLQAEDADAFMSRNLGKRYVHWDMFSANNVEFNSYSSIPDVLEFGTQFVEEKRDEINRVVELLLEN